MRDKMIDAFDNNQDMKEFFNFDEAMSWDELVQEKESDSIKIQIEADRDIFKLLSQKADKAGVSLNAYIKIILAERAGIA